MSIHWERYTFKFNEFRDGDKQGLQTKKSDVHIYLQQDCLVPYPSKWAIHQRSFTLCIDLHQTEAELRQAMNRTTRYQVNKGARENLRLVYIDNPTDEEIEEFALFFNPFAAEKRIGSCRVDKLQAMRKEQMLLLTYVLNQQGEKLAGHAYIFNQKRASMFYSCNSRFTNKSIPGVLVSCANRYMHWQNILYFKRKNLSVYDFMGLSTDSNNHEGQSLNRFKKGFGGEKRYEYQSLIPQSMKGKLLMIVLKFLWRNKDEMIVSNQLDPMSHGIQK